MSSARRERRSRHPEADVDAEKAGRRGSARCPPAQPGAALGFEPDAELVLAVEQMRDRLRIISAERIRDELSKLLLADDPSPGLWMVARTKLAEEFLPELNAMELEQDPIHRHKDVLAHTIAVVAKTSPRLWLCGNPIASLRRSLSSSLL